jgi:Domain of unknown function (DUF4396)
MSRRWQRERGDPPGKPGYVVTATGVAHCRAGCTLGDIVAEFAVFGLGVPVAGLTLGADYLGDYLAALALGIVFQYFAIVPMRGLSRRRGLTEAAKADVASLTAFEIGLFGWVTLMTFVFFPGPHHLHPDSPVYRFGMIAGFFTAWPVNVWLIRAAARRPCSEQPSTLLSRSWARPQYG